MSAIRSTAGGGGGIGGTRNDDQQEEDLDVLYYDAPFPLYAAAFSNHPNHPRRIATGSFLSSSFNNKIHIIDPSRGRRHADDDDDDDDDDERPSRDASGGGPDFDLRTIASHAYPVTKLAFEPIRGGGGGEGSSSRSDRHRTGGTGAAGRMSTSTSSGSSSSGSGSSSSDSTTDSSSPRSGSSSSSDVPAGAVGVASGGRIGSLGYEQSERSRELLASAADVLRIWEISERDDDDDDLEEDGEETDRRRQMAAAGYVGANRSFSRPTCRIRERSRLTNSKAPVNSLPPLTSLSWNAHSPAHIVTSSVDTTCSIFDLTTSTAVTQLIAHDRAVYDVSWLPSSSDVFVSVGADGSLRAFDLRSLEHSTILYETPDARPLARIAFSAKEQHYLATFGIGDKRAVVLDMRSPGQPVAELKGHERPKGSSSGGNGGLSALAWGCEQRGHTGGGGWVATAGDDAQVLLFDLTHPLPFPASAATSAAPSAAGSPANDSTRTTSGALTASSRPMSTTSAVANAATSAGAGGTSGVNGKSSGSTAIPTKPIARYPAFAWTNTHVDYTDALGGAGRNMSTGGSEIVNLAWSKDDRRSHGRDGGGSWLAAVSGRRLTCLRF